MKRLLILLVLVLSLATIFVACGESDIPSTSNTVGANSDTGSSKSPDTTADTGSSKDAEDNTDTESSKQPESSTDTESSTNKDPVDDNPTDDNPTDDNPTDDNPTDDDPTDDNPTDDDPTDDNPTDDNPTDDNPTDDNPTDDNPPVEEPEYPTAYDFRMQDMNGNDIQLSHLLDKPVVLNFWASWCPPCKAEMPSFEKLYKQYGEDINFVMVSVDSTMTDAKSFISQYRYTFPAYLDAYNEGYNEYNVKAIPRTYFITTSNEIFISHLSYIAADQLEENIKQLMKEEGIEIKEPEPVNVPINIAVNGESDYLVVYDDSDVRVSEFAEKLVSYVKSTYNIELNMAKSSEGIDSEHCIYIGDVAGAKWAKARIGTSNDFGACISGDDYVLYATNSRLYEYLYQVLMSDLLVSIKDGSWSAQPENDFVYSESMYSETSFVDYTVNKNGGKLTQDILLKFFEPRTFVASDGTELAYRIYVPYDYDNGTEYPFLTVLHGAGERGNNNTGNMHHMMLNFFSQENSPFWESIVVCPQCPNGQQWVDTPWEQGGYSIDAVPESNELKAVMEIVDMVEADFPTDTNRYYVTGLSMGGFGAWDLIMRHTERFAAAVPLCGGADVGQAEKLLNKPIYTVHGTADFSVPISGTSDMVAAIKNLGGDKIFYEEMYNYGHNVWDYASRKAEIWTWLFKQSLN